MSVNSAVVLPSHSHINVAMSSKGSDHVSQQKEYAATYHIGKSVVNVVAPPERTEEEIQQIHNDIESACNAIMRSLQAKFNSLLEKQPNGNVKIIIRILGENPPIEEYEKMLNLLKENPENLADILNDWYE